MSSPLPLWCLLGLTLIAGACSGSDAPEQEFQFSFDWTEQAEHSDADILQTADIHCPDGLRAGPQGLCMPHVGVCENRWELPLVGGGCLAIGPRACSKGWSEPADSDCEIGEMLACPEGFVQIEEGSACVPQFTTHCKELEIPVLGGGCLQVGPQWEVLKETAELPYCPKGNINLQNGECAQVGPRACSRLWAPDSDENCQAGDLLDCPEGWEETEGGLACEPTLDECPSGRMPVLGGGCTDVQAAVDCAVDGFPPAPAEAGTAHYVDAASTCTNDCGSKLSPHKSVQQAINTAAEGDAILLAPGVYDEGLLIDKPLYLAGTCAAQTRLTGSVPVEHSKLHLSDDAVIAILDTHDVTIARIGLAGDSPGLAAIHAKDTVVDDVEIVGSLGGPIELQGTTSMTVTGSWIHDSIATPGTWPLGNPVVLGPGATLTATHSLLEGFPGKGIHAEGTGASVKLDGCVIRDGYPIAGGDAGIGLMVAFKAHAEITDCLFERSTRSALEVAKEGTLNASRTVIRDTQNYKNIYGGTAVETRHGGTALLDWCLINGNIGASAGSYDPDSSTSFNHCVIRDTKMLPQNQVGMGVVALKGGHVQMDASLVQRAYDVASLTAMDNASSTIRGSLVLDTKAPAKTGRGTAFEAGHTGNVQITHSAIEEARTHSLLSFHEGSEMVVRNSVIRGSLPDPMGADGFTAAVFCAQMGHLELHNTVIEQCVDEAVMVEGKGSTGLFQHVVIRDIVEGQDPNPPAGLTVLNGAKATISDCLVQDVEEYGIEVLHEGTDVTVERTTVRDIASDSDGYRGGGIAIFWGASCSVEQCLLERNGMALGASNSGTNVAVRGSCLRGGSKAPGTLFGQGIQASAGAQVEIESSVFEDNLGADVVTFDPGTYLRFQSSTLRDTKAAVLPEIGSGIRAWDGSRVDLVDSLLERNVESAVYAGTGSQLLVKRTSVRDTKPGAGGAGGAMVVSSASAKISGSLIANSTGHGILAGLPETVLEMKGTLILDTAPLENGAQGTGFIAVDGGTMDILASRIAGAHTAGVLVEDAGTTLALRFSAVEGTKKGARRLADTGRTQSFGDGLFCGLGAQATIVDSSITGSSRCGAYFLKSSGQMTNSVVWANNSYGLAMDRCNGGVTFKEGNNQIVGNALELPDTLALEVTTTPGSLPPPVKPQVDVDDPDEKDKEPEELTVEY